MNNVLDPALETEIIKLINIVSFRHQLKKKKTPLKAKKRVFSGFNEVTKALKSSLDEKKPKLVIIAVDIQLNPLEGGTDELTRKLLTTLDESEIPYYFGGTKTELGIAIYGKPMTKGKKVRCACIAIVDVQGSETEFKDIMARVYENKAKFKSTNL